MSRVAWRAFKDGIGSGTVIWRAGAAILHQGSPAGEHKPPPDRRLFASINQL